jgi:hypothetical protein
VFGRRLLSKLSFFLCQSITFCPPFSPLQALGVKPKAPKQLKQPQLDKQDMQRLLHGNRERLCRSCTAAALLHSRRLPCRCSGLSGLIALP